MLKPINPITKHPPMPKNLPPRRKPHAELLTDEEILKIGADNGIGYVRHDNSVIQLNIDEAEYFIAFARAIEKRIREGK